MVQQNNSGVFGYLVDQMAFIDRIELSIWGKRRKRPGKSVSMGSSVPIGGPDRLYARASNGFCLATGNPFQFRHGVLRFPKRVPPCRLILRSDRTPLSCAQVELVIDAIMRRGCRVRVSKLELTFDLSKGVSVEYFTRHWLARARRTRTLRDQGGRRTLYVGGPNSEWFLRVYDKAAGLVRVEFVFRLASLRRMGIIGAPHELVFLRRLPLSKLVGLREVDMSKLPNITECDDPAEPASRALRNIASNFSIKDFYAVARRRRDWRDDWIQACAIEKQLRRMQRKLLW